MEKVSLPIKTKIAAWWMMIVAMLCSSLVVSQFRFFPRDFWLQPLVYITEMISLAFVLIGLLLIVANFFVLRKKKWAWWLAMVAFIPFFLCAFLLVIYGLGHFTLSLVAGSFGYCLSLLVALILLLLDRKNFWKIAT